MGFTHVELMPVTEHPFYGSWGYQTTGYFAPTARYGTPQDFMYLVDTLHQHGIGVILDWVPSHFPGDAHGLAYFDGTHLYEHADPRQGFHPEWNSYIFNYGRHEVRAFLLSSALFWLDKYHVDGLRVDAVASMLYLDYGRKDGEWIPNRYGGKENLEAIEFLRRLNAGGLSRPSRRADDRRGIDRVADGVAAGASGRPRLRHEVEHGLDARHAGVLRRRPGPPPLPSRPPHVLDLIYAFNENFVLPLSHDEVVHGKGSLLAKMPGDAWQQFANLRLLFGYMWTHPGKKLLFMGGEFGQWREWNHDESLDWSDAGRRRSTQVAHWVGDLNRSIAPSRALHELDFESAGFEWIDCSDTEQSWSPSSAAAAAASRCWWSATSRPVPRPNYVVGVPAPGYWREVLNSDAPIYGGSGIGNLGGVEAAPVPAHGRRIRVAAHAAAAAAGGALETPVTRSDGREPGSMRNAGCALPGDGRAAR